MVRRVVSLVRTAPVALRDEDPVLEANAYAVTEAIDLTVVLAGPAVELALAAGGDEPDSDSLPSPSAPQDLRALLESGVPVCVDGADLGHRGIPREDLVVGVRVLDPDGVAAVLRNADAVLSW